MALRYVIASVCVSMYLAVCVYQSRAGPHDNSSLVQAKITKFWTRNAKKEKKRQFRLKFSVFGL